MLSGEEDDETGAARHRSGDELQMRAPRADTGMMERSHRGPMISQRILSFLALVAGTLFFLSGGVNNDLLAALFVAGTLYIAWTCARKGKPALASFAVVSIIVYIVLPGVLFLFYGEFGFIPVLVAPPLIMNLATAAFLLGTLMWYLALVGAIRVAKPDSKWARNRYVGTPIGERNMAIARQRFPSNAPVEAAELDR